MVAVRPIDPWADQQRAAFLRMAPLVESAAEALLLPALLALGGPEAHFFGPAGLWTLEAQVTVPTSGRTYRVDFAVTRGNHKVAIEVDGWAHHRANEAQKAYDAGRDFAMKDRRWAVVRVEAVAVFANPTDVAGRVSSRLSELESGIWDPFAVPVEKQSDEEFARTVQRFESSIAAAEAAGAVDSAEGGRRKLKRILSAREREEIKRQMSAADAAGDDDRAMQLLRLLFEKRVNS